MSAAQGAPQFDFTSLSLPLNAHPIIIKPDIHVAQPIAIAPSGTPLAKEVAKPPVVTKEVSKPAGALASAEVAKPAPRVLPPKGKKLKFSTHGVRRK